MPELRRVSIGELSIDSGEAVILDAQMITGLVRSVGRSRDVLEAIDRLMSSFPTLRRRGDVGVGIRSAISGGVAFEVDSDGNYDVYGEYDDARGRLRRVIVDLPD